MPTKDPESDALETSCPLPINALVYPEVHHHRPAFIPTYEAAIQDPTLARVAGAVLGAAIGDAMGHPTEFLSSFEAIRQQYGERGVTGFELFWERDGRRFAPYTDDTQMAEIVLRSLLVGGFAAADLDNTMRTIAEGFVRWAKAPQGGHRAPGNTCMEACRELAQGVPWMEAGGPTAGDGGSVVRAYPFGLAFAHDVERVERWSVAQSMLTHRDPTALAASAAMAVGVARCFLGQTISRILSEMVAAASRYSVRTARTMTEAWEEANGGEPPEVTLQRNQGWAAHEAIAAAVYIVARHPADPVRAILEGANTPGDSDTIATLAGALVGARVGLAAFPRSWAEEVERSTVLMQLAAVATELLA